MNHYEPEKINGPFADKYKEYKSSGSENTSNNVSKQLDHVWVISLMILEHLDNGKPI